MEQQFDQPQSVQQLAEFDTFNSGIIMGATTVNIANGVTYPLSLSLSGMSKSNSIITYNVTSLGACRPPDVTSDIPTSRCAVASLDMFIQPFAKLCRVNS
jgi:hypothetical protein